jgi:predicted MFS family arabinose efflux permease
MPRGSRRAGRGGTRARLTATARALKEVVARPELRRAEVAFALACTSETAFTLALGIIAFREGGAGAVGLVALLRMVPSALGSTVLTPFADSARRELVLAVATLARAAAIGAAALLFASGSPAWTIYTSAVVATVGITIFRPVHSALLPLLCAETTTLTSANVVRGTLEAAATLAGPVLAGVLLAVAGPTAVLVAAAVLAIATALPLLGIRSTTGRRTAPVRIGTVLSEIGEGVRTVAEHRDLAMVFGLGFAQTVVRGALNVFIVVVALGLLDRGDGTVAAFAAGVGLGGLFGSLGASLLVGSRDLGRWLAIALVLWGGPIALMGAAPATVAVFCLLMVVGLANALIDVPLFTLPVRLVDDAVLARAFGLFEAVVALGVALGSVLGPLLIATTGLRMALVVTGALLPVLAAVAWRALRALDARLEVRDEEISVLRGVGMLALLPVPTIEHLASRLHRRSVPAGQPVFEQGEPGDSAFVVVRGTADVVGDGHVVTHLAPGDAFGEIAVLHDVARTASVVADSDLDLFELDRDDLLEALGRHQPSSDAAYAAVAERLARYRPAAVGV